MASVQERGGGGGRGPCVFLSMNVLQEPNIYRLHLDVEGRFCRRFWRRAPGGGVTLFMHSRILKTI